MIRFLVGNGMMMLSKDRKSKSHHFSIRVVLPKSEKAEDFSCPGKIPS